MAGSAVNSKNPQIKKLVLLMSGQFFQFFSPNQSGPDGLLMGITAESGDSALCQAAFAAAKVAHIPPSAK